MISVPLTPGWERNAYEMERERLQYARQYPDADDGIEHLCCECVHWVGGWDCPGVCELRAQEEVSARFERGTTPSWGKAFYEGLEYALGNCSEGDEDTDCPRWKEAE